MKLVVNHGFLAVLAVAAGLAAPAAAAPLTITYVDGIWENASPVVSGGGTNEIRWGDSAGWGQSGYNFDSSAVPFDAEEDTAFVLGTFEHLNFPVYGTFLQSVDLAVEFMIDGVADPITSVFSFAHWETLNNQGGTCTSGNGGSNWSGVNVNGCADRVTATLNLGQSEIFQIDGISYVLDILGFQYDGALMSAFWTTERETNVAELVAIFRTVDGEVPPDTPPEVPLPASGLLLLGGLAGLIAARRRR